MPDFRPTADVATLHRRAELLRATRSFFADRGFLEVETPLLSADTVVDRHLDPLAAELTGIGRPRWLWLQTSPEFAMKRLLTTPGLGPIYQITRAFRQGERGPRHNPEFTIVEWYRPGDDYDAGMRLLSDLCNVLLGRGDAQRLTYAEAFRQYVGLDPHAATLAEVITVAERRAPSGAAAFKQSAIPADRDAWLDLLLVECVESQLGRGSPTILCDYPATQAALAQVRGEPPVAERFELYVDGLELANGYHELLDAEALLQRNVENNRLRTADGKPPLPEQSRLVDAMRAGLPPCTGCALGFDRVVMLACGKHDIADVLTFPIERA